MEMTLNDFRKELKKWKLTRYKILNFAISLTSLLIYEFIGRPFYRPYIYKNNINDFHIADTLGNSLGTIATIFFFIAVFSNDAKRGIFMIKLITVSLVLFELAHPLLGKKIDTWDILATLITGAISFLIYILLLKKSS